MAITKWVENEINTIFAQQEKLDPQGLTYQKNKELLARKLLKVLGNSIKSCIQYWVSKYRIDSSDAESLIYESLLFAIDNFKISRGHCKFTSFFWTVNSQTFKNHLSKIYAQKRTPQALLPLTGNIQSEINKKGIFAPLYSFSSQLEDEDTSITLENIIKDSSTFEIFLQHKLLLEKIYNEATPKQKRVIKRLYFGKSYTEVGKQLKMSASDICNLVKKVRIKYDQLQDEL